MIVIFIDYFCALHGIRQLADKHSWATVLPMAIGINKVMCKRGHTRLPDGQEKAIDIFQNSL